MKALFVLAVLILLIRADDEGTRRMKELRSLSRRSANSIIVADGAQFREYLMKYPRPYDVVVYFTSQNCKLCNDLYPEYEYLAFLYYNNGIIDQNKNPVFFMQVTYSSDTADIFQMMDFNTAPNLLVSKPKMAVVSEAQRKGYLQGFKWSISYSDGHVTTHKMLEFANKRTGKEVTYKPTFLTMLTTLTAFLLVCVVGVVAYTRLRTFWMRWQVWFGGAILIYITCVSGVVYDIIHDVPFVGVDNKGQAVIFSGGNREQYGAEGLVVSLIISAVGVLLIMIPAIYKKMQKGGARVISVIFLVFVVMLVKLIESYYREKGWYNPMWSPPGDYQRGHFMVDQGNNI